ncbi:PKD domain-containing protein [Arthrobacter sp. UYEF3]|uniref:PKD domain-containing protein n=1 Tax=Arthrobacter sp. UYEF3 TaxID=1756365 RepID=UPI003392D134
MRTTTKNYGRHSAVKISRKRHAGMFEKGMALASAAMLAALALVVVPPATADTAPADPMSPASPVTVSADALPTVQIDGVVWQQVVVGNIVYAAGNFKTARPAGAAPGTNTVPRLNLLAFDLTTGNLINSFAPSLNAEARSIAASPDGTRIYVGGSFTRVNGTAVSQIAAVDANTGALITSFMPLPNSRVNAIVATDTAVYAGGWFNAVGSVLRSNLAAFSAADGGLLPWAPNAAGGGVNAMVLSPDKGKVALGGAFSSLNGSSNPGYGLGMVDATSGSSLPFSANNVVKDAGNNAAILSLSSDGTNLYGSGYVYGSGGNLEGTFSANWSDGSLTWLEDCHGDSYGIYAAPTAVYVVSHEHYCGTIGGFPQASPQSAWIHHRATAFSKSATGTITQNKYPDYANFAGNPSPTLLNWFPDLDYGTYTGQNQGAWTVAGNSQYVVLGGEFLHVNGTAQQGLVRLATKDIAPNKQGPTVTGSNFNPSLITTSTGTVRVNWQANWDRDNENLRYDVIRDGDTGHPVFTTTQASTSWNRPAMSFTDKGLAPGSTHGYRVFATDPFGNTARSDTVNVNVASNLALSGYGAAVFQDGAQSYWRLGEGTGATVTDWAGFSNLTAGSGVTRGASGAIVGDTNTASAFNGTSSGKAVGPWLMAGADTYTSEAWFRTTSSNGGKILGFGDSNTKDSSSYDRQIYMDNSGRIWCGVYYAGTKTVNSAASYNDGLWHHAAATLGGGILTLYVDGQKVGEQTGVPYGQPYSGYWKVGGDSLNGWPAQPRSNYFSGDIDDVAIYPSVLTAQQVQNHFTLSGEVVNKAPVAAFTSSATSLRASFDASASSDPDGTVASYAWDFGDGSAAGNGKTVSHAYAASGTYQVTLRVTDDKGASNTLTKPVTVAFVNQPPVASFISSSSALTASFDASGSYDSDGTVASYAWNFGDGSAAGSGVAAQHGYAAAGTYQATLTVTDNNGASNAITKAVTVATINQAPVAAFTTSYSGLTASFEGSGSSDPDGTVVSYAWDFGDGSAPGNGATAQHSYSAAGTYNVTLTVTDDKGATNTAANLVTLASPNQPPAAAFTSSSADLTASFDASGSSDPDGTVASYAWDFGDNSAAGSGVAPSHPYTAAGTYQVALSVTDDKGATNSVTHAVTVAAPNKPPVAAFTSSSSGLTASFNAAGSSDSDGTIASYAWDFGDGSAAGSGATPSHAYAAAGSYQVKLVVTDNQGAAGSASGEVSVSDVLAQDGFTRNVALGFGTADVGGPWSVDTGAGQVYSVSGGFGRFVTNAAGQPSATLGSVSSRSTDITVKVSLDKKPDGGGYFVSLIGRKVGNSDYRAKVWIASTGQMTLYLTKIISGAETAMTTTVLPGVAYAAGDQLQIRLQVNGLLSSTINGKVWKTTAVEPLAWTASTTDTTAGLQTAGSVGLLTYLSRTATVGPVTASFTSLTAKVVG